MDRETHRMRRNMWARDAHLAAALLYAVHEDMAQTIGHDASHTKSLRLMTQRLDQIRRELQR